MNSFHRNLCGLALATLFAMPLSALDLASASGKLIPESPEVTAIKRQDGDAIRLLIQDAAGKTLFESDVLGSEEKLFRVEDRDTSLAIRDLTGDGIPEALASAFYGPKASGLYVFTYDLASHTFVPVQVTFPKDDLTRDLFVSDIQARDGSDMHVAADNTVTVIGMQYSEKEGEQPIPAAFTFTFEKGRFIHRKTELLKAE
ncbi:MAG TPA: hypothetical protein PLP29_00785 [Candidatus Ozemobacteraceae bacterium]|nr:hypothetical protein [Candidatus Ozemobacteraceae bacterium]